MKAFDDADRAQHPFALAYFEACPSHPHALRSRINDHPFHASGRHQIEGSTSWSPVYVEQDIEDLRVASEPMMLSTGRADSLEGCGLAWRPDPRRMARKAEILAAWDAWQAELERLRETTGLNAANTAVEVIVERVNAIEDRILDYLPRTFEGLQAKARWIASGFCPKQHAEHLLRDLCRMPPIALAPPAHVTPSMEVVETYRAFLHMELRFLNWETHGTAHASAGIWLDNPAGSLHGGDGPPPSSRAIAVLSNLPILPQLAESIAATRTGDLAFIATAAGSPMVKEGFGNWFRDVCNAAGVKGSAQGLRKLAATRAADNGATEAQLEAAFGWRGGGMASLYTRAANRKKLAIEAMDKMAPREQTAKSYSRTSPDGAGAKAKK